MTNKIIFATVFAIFAPCALIFSSPAQAATDYKSFSSNICVPNAPASSNDLTYSTLGLLNTSATTDRVVICPLVKDEESEWVPGLPANVYVDYRTAAGLSGRVNCSIVVGSISSGSYTATSSEPLTPANSTGYITLQAQTESTWYYEPVNLVCSLSPRTRLTRIYLRESGVTNTP